MPGSLLQKLLSERWFECIQDKENVFWRPIIYCSQLSVLDIGREKKQEMWIMGDCTGSNQGTDPSDSMDAGLKMTAPITAVEQTAVMITLSFSF